MTTARKGIVTSILLSLLIAAASWSQSVLKVHPHLQVADFPVNIRPLQKRNAFALSSFLAKKQKGNLVFELKCQEQDNKKQNFLLMVYLAFEKKLFLAYYTDEVRQVFITPEGKNGDVAFTMAGYKEKTTSSNVRQLNFELPLSMYGLWSISKDQGTAYVFLLSTDKEQQIADDSFLAISNVVSKKFQ
jgi:hypothetical protein